MPNITSEGSLPEGFFFESDNYTDYEVYYPQDEMYENTITLIGVSNEGQLRFYKIMDMNEETISLLSLVQESLCEQTFFRIKKIGTRHPYRNKGYAKYLYSLALNDCPYPLISDLNLTMPGSYNIWNGFINTQSVNLFEILYIDTSTCISAAYDGDKPKEYYWGHDEDVLNEYKEDNENLEMMLYDGVLAQELYDYLKNNLEILTNRVSIRLILKKNSEVT